MRTIVKQGAGGVGAYHLAQAHATPPPTADAASSRWRSYAHKDALRQSLLTEQFALCCYSEVRPDQLELGYHIEHVQPKSLAPQRTFDYQNMALSALDSDYDLPSFKAQGQALFGGHAKQSNYDATQFISCHQADCARFFAYLSDGRVTPAHALNPAEQAKAAYTIGLLNLNSPYLITLRRKWWDELDQLFEQHLQDNWSLDYLAACDLVPANYRLSRFFSLTRQFFGPTAERVLQQQAPQLLGYSHS